MTVLDYILDGIEAELALERELGVRSIECDCELVGTAVPRGPQSEPNVNALNSDCGAVRTPRPTMPSTAPSSTSNLQPPTSNLPPVSYDFVFLHDRALSTGGVEMMAKIITAMGKTPASAPIVFTGERPEAKVYVVLGGNALKKWFPGLHTGPNTWPVHQGKTLLVTYSPEYILRFGAVTPPVQKIKREMWNQLKAVMAKVRTV